MHIGGALQMLLPSVGNRDGMDQYTKQRRRKPSSLASESSLSARPQTVSNRGRQGRRPLQMLKATWERVHWKHRARSNPPCAWQRQRADRPSDIHHLFPLSIPYLVARTLEMRFLLDHGNRS